MLLNLPVARSPGARILFFGSGLVTVAVLLWANALPSTERAADLAPIFLYLFTVLDYPGADCALLILVTALWITSQTSFRPLLRWIGQHPVTVAAVSAPILCAGTLLVYRNHPLSMDEYAAVFQSQVFAAGRLAGQLPPQLLDWLVPAAFQDHFLFVSHSTGRITSAYWPSFALLLTPFTWLGIPWACNPVISALTLIAVHRLALRLFGDPESAGLAILLTIASPVFFANGISYYSMPAHLLANAAYALLLIDPTPRRALVAGLVGSVALTLHNPVPHMLFALPWIIWLLTRSGGFRLTAWLAAGYLPLCLLLGVGWFLFSSGVVHDGARAAAGMSQPAGVFARASSAFGIPSPLLLLARLIGLAKIWVWAVPGMLILAGAGAWKCRHDAWCRLLIASALATLVGFLFVPLDQGHGWGFRYFHSAWFVLPLLAAGALTPRLPVSQAATQSLTRRPAAVFEDNATLTFLVACALLTLVAGVGFRAYQIRDLITENLRHVPPDSGHERRVVIIDSRFSPYRKDLVQNDPWLRGNVIRMVSHGPSADADMMREEFPQMRRISADPFGSVWTADSQPIAAGQH